MARYLPKHLNNKSNQGTSIHRHVKEKRPKKPHQKSPQKTGAMKVNATTEQLGGLDGNGHVHNNNTNHFTPLIESNDEEGTQNRTKPNTTIILLSEEGGEDKNKGEQNEDNEEYEDDRENKKMEKKDNPDSDDELNRDFGITEFDDNSDNDEEEHIPRAKLKTIKKTINNKNKSFPLTANKSSLKENPTSKINEEDNDETMYTSLNQDEDKVEEMTLESKPSILDPHNNDQVINSYDEIESTLKLLEDYFDKNIDHNHPNLPMIRKTVK